MHQPEPTDGETLNNEELPYKKKRTPLPWMQLLPLYLIQASEPLAALLIFPFINQFIRETGITKGDERRTGYYAGIVESAFFFAEGITVVPWGMASDRFGRRPTLLLGPLGLTLALFGFGMSSQFWSLVLFRWFKGAFNGNIGIAKSVIGEITDSSNVADAFALTPVAWASGVAIGPFIGGFLARPAENWPDTLGRIAYLKAHPYFLPCLAVAVITFIAFLSALVFLKETLPSASLRQKFERKANTSTTSLVPSDDVSSYGTIHDDHPPSELESASHPLLSDEDLKPPSVIALLKLREIQVVIAVYGFLGFCDMGVLALTPLMWSTSIEHGGLGLSTYAIGIALGWYGVLDSLFQVMFLGKLMRRFGPRNVFIVCFSCLIPTILNFPISNYFARQANGMDWKVWSMVVLSLATQSARSGAYGSLMVMVTASAPSRSSLGTVNGLAQALGSISKSFGPSFATSLFAMSIQHPEQMAGGNAGYYIMMITVAIGIRFTLMLPKR